MTHKQRLSRHAVPIALVACALWFLIAMTRAEAPLAFVQAVAVGVALYILIREGCRPLRQAQRDVPWRHR